MMGYNGLFHAVNKHTPLLMIKIYVLGGREGGTCNMYVLGEGVISIRAQADYLYNVGGGGGA